ncbi:hypothetical protein QE611_04120 [Streptococcus suis]|uniref:DUF6900 domain-containing protein n=1 Tax=Streptococcus suis TaxID=1307 RepID=UPI003708F835
MTTQMQKDLAGITYDHFGRPNLERQWSDSLDFLDVAVWTLQSALEAAYKAGQESMKTK